MQKFTIFSAILTIIIVVVVAQIIVTDYLPELSAEESGELLASVYGANREGFLGLNGIGGQSEVIPDEDVEVKPTDVSTDEEIVITDNDELFDNTEIKEVKVPTNLVPVNTTVSKETPLLDSQGLNPFEPLMENENPQIEPVDFETAYVFEDFEDRTYEIKGNSFLSADHVQKAGFTNSDILEESHSGYLYKTISVTDLESVTVKKFNIQDQVRLFAKVYVFAPGANLGADGVYKAIRNKAANSLNCEVNVTNEFGEASFYMNDSTRRNTAFLTVKMGYSVYSFSYPKEYHPQIKNLIGILYHEKK